MSACTRQRTLPETHYGDTGTTPSKVVRCVLNADHVGYHVDEDGLPFGPWIETSVPPTQPPAAPETDVNAFGPDGFTRLAGDAALLADLSAARERVRVVEGERDAAVDRLCDGLHKWREDAEHYRARAESAEAAHRALQAAVEALADEYAEYGAQREAAGRPAWPNNVARDLRALLAGGEER